MESNIFLMQNISLYFRELQPAFSIRSALENRPNYLVLIVRRPHSRKEMQDQDM